MNTNIVRLAIISDTHGYIDPPVVEVIRRCDQVLHAGDICGAHVLEQLHQLKSQVTAVAGNNDAAGLWPIEATEVVNALPKIARLQLPGGELVVEHGHLHGMQQPDHASLRLTHPQARVIVYGHTHCMLVDKENTPWVVNPGAAGATRTNGGASCLILTASASKEWDVEMLRFPLDEIA